jgi:hypothetical protein
MLYILFLTCILGSIIQYWRFVADGGFGLGPTNRPMVLWTPAGNLAVFAAGLLLKWGDSDTLNWTLLIV